MRGQREAAERAEKVAPYFDAHAVAAQEAETRTRQLAGARAQRERCKEVERAAQQEYEKSADGQLVLEELQNAQLN